MYYIGRIIVWFPRLFSSLPPKRVAPQNCLDLGFKKFHDGNGADDENINSVFTATNQSVDVQIWFLETKIGHLPVVLSFKHVFYHTQYTQHTTVTT